MIDTLFNRLKIWGDKNGVHVHDLRFNGANKVDLMCSISMHEDAVYVENIVQVCCDTVTNSTSLYNYSLIEKVIISKLEGTKESLIIKTPVTYDILNIKIEDDYEWNLLHANTDYYQKCDFGDRFIVPWMYEICSYFVTIKDEIVLGHNFNYKFWKSERQKHQVQLVDEFKLFVPLMLNL